MSDEPGKIIYREVMPENFTRMTLTTRDGHYTITLMRGDLTIEALIEDVFEPLLLAAGYHPENVNESLYQDPQKPDEATP